MRGRRRASDCCGWRKMHISRVVSQALLYFPSQVMVTSPPPSSQGAAPILKFSLCACSFAFIRSHVRGHM